VPQCGGPLQCDDVFIAAGNNTHMDLEWQRVERQVSHGLEQLGITREAW
jgi:hypothetical protein